MQISGLSPTQVLEKFIRGLKPKPRIEVELRDSKAPDEAYCLADRFDRIVYGTKGTTFLSHDTRPTINLHTSQPRHMRQLGLTVTQCKLRSFAPGLGTMLRNRPSTMDVLKTNGALKTNGLFKTDGP